MSSIVIGDHPPPPPPVWVTPLQARRALRSAGMMAAVEAYIDADATGQMREEWDFAVEIHRDSAFIEDARVALQLTTLQLDDLFRLAATL